MVAPVFLNQSLLPFTRYTHLPIHQRIQVEAAFGDGISQAADAAQHGFDMDDVVQLDLQKSMYQFYEVCL